MTRISSNQKYQEPTSSLEIPNDMMDLEQQYK